MKGRRLPHRTGQKTGAWKDPYDPFKEIGSDLNYINHERLPDTESHDQQSVEQESQNIRRFWQSAGSALARNHDPRGGGR